MGQSIRFRGLVAAVAIAMLPALVACTGGSKGRTAGATAELVAHATSLDGGAATPAEMNEAVRILKGRLDAAGLSAQVSATGAELHVAVDASLKVAATSLVTELGVFGFRQVLGSASGSPADQPDAGGAGPASLPVKDASSTDPRKVRAVFETYDCSAAAGVAPTRGLERPQDYMVACDQSAAIKYFLGPAAVDGTHIRNPNAVLESTTNQWLVQIGFDGSGKDAWFQLTKKAYEADPSQSTLMCQQVNVDRGCNEIAMTLDGVVLSAPSSQQDGIPGGQTQITGAFTKQRAQSLVEVLKYGALPVRIVIQTVTTS